MAFGKKKSLTLEERHAAADEKAQSVLDLFHSIADGLHEAADEHDSVVSDAESKIREAEEEIQRLAALREAAASAATEKARKAESIRALVS